MEENTKNTKNTKKIVLGVVLFAVVIAVLFGCWKVFGAKTTQGAKSYTLTVQDDKGDKKSMKAIPMRSMSEAHWKS